MNVEITCIVGITSKFLSLITHLNVPDVYYQKEVGEQVVVVVVMVVEAVEAVVVDFLEVAEVVAGPAVVQEGDSLEVGVVVVAFEAADSGVVDVVDVAFVDHSKLASTNIQYTGLHIHSLVVQRSSDWNSAAVIRRLSVRSF